MADTDDLEPIEEETTQEEIPSKLVKGKSINGNGKPRKALSPEHLAKLALARDKANAIRKQNAVKKLETKVATMTADVEKVLPKKENIKKEVIETELKEPEEKEEKKEIKEEKKEIKEIKEEKPKHRGKKTKIIVEQSSDDSDDFEPNDNVIFVKRTTRKKKVEPPPPEPEPPPQQQYEPPPQLQRQEQRRLPPRQLTREEQQLNNQYESMFNGGFLNNQFGRKHY